MLEGLAQILAQSGTSLGGLILVFVRVAAAVALMPGFGEQAIPSRVRLMAAIGFTLVVWPMVEPVLPDINTALPAFGGLIVIEAGIGFLIGISLRLLVMALQLAGSIAAQSTAITQVAGVGVTPDPMPAIGNILMLAGLALALVTGLHIKASLAIASTYDLFPLGTIPIAGDIAEWGIARVSDVFAFGFTMSAPFVIASFAYNLALGAINRAMPSLLVAFVGAPLITAGALLLLLLAGPTIITVWNDRLDMVLANPMGMPE
ncbi:MAG: flagellar biosynthetic protein FliR [Rhodobacteraceae bacterium]|nr:flagellar biosynthetic protein FliR [Paracoccaceae bacterium]